MLLVTLSLLSLIFLWRAPLTNWVKSWFGFIVSITLAVFAHFNALFVLFAQGLYATTIWIGRVWTCLIAPRDRRKDLTAPLLVLMLAFAAVGLLLIPALVRLLGLPWIPTSGSGVDTAAMSVPGQWTAAFSSRIAMAFRPCHRLDSGTVAWLRACRSALNPRPATVAANAPFAALDLYTLFGSIPYRDSRCIAGTASSSRLASRDNARVARGNWRVLGLGPVARARHKAPRHRPRNAGRDDGNGTGLCPFATRLLHGQFQKGTPGTHDRLRRNARGSWPPLPKPRFVPAVLSSPMFCATLVRFSLCEQE
jgi:hypothetical protein